MIGVGCRGSTRRKIRVLARFGDDSQDSAEAMAKSLAEHNQGEFFVFLVDRGKYRILRRFKKSLRIAFPTLRHPFPLPSYRVTGR
jgi:hypothetical protein